MSERTMIMGNGSMVGIGECTVPRSGYVNQSFIEAALIPSQSGGIAPCSCDLLAHILNWTGDSTILYCDTMHPISTTLAEEIVYTILFYTIIAISVVGNFTVIWIVLFHERMRTVTNYYLLNLAISDASISILNTSFTWRFNFEHVWRWGSLYCSVNAVMGIAPITASVITMIVMSIDRYWAVVHPLRKRPGRKITIAVILVIWAGAFFLSFPTLLVTKVERNFMFSNGTVYNGLLCLSDNFPDGDSIQSTLFGLYSFIISLVQYFIPLAVLSFTYWKVGGVLRKKESVGDIRHYRNIAAKKKASKMLALVVFIFMFVWLPYHIFFLINTYMDEHITWLFGRICDLLGVESGPFIMFEPETQAKVYLNIYLLAMSSTIYNPIIYYFMNKRFCIGFKYAFRWLPFVQVDQCEYACQLGSQCPRGTSIAPSYHSASHSQPLTNAIVTDF